MRKNNPEVWDKLLSEITPVIGPAVIAGGCVRDFVVCGEDRSPKDIDVFIPAEDSLSVEFLLADIQDLPRGSPFLDFTFLTQKGTYEPDPDVSGVLEGWWAKGIDSDALPIEQRVNVIGRRENFLSDPSILVRKFDHSLCQFWYTPEKGVKMTDAAKKTLDTKAITLYSDDKRTKNRVANLIVRNGYEDFTYEGQLRPTKKEVLRRAEDILKIQEFARLYGANQVPIPNMLVDPNRLNELARPI